MIEQIDKTTFQFKMPSGDTVEIGDRESLDFKPHLKLNRWGGECFICPSIEQTGACKLRIQDNCVERESNLSRVRFYPLPPSEQWELGSFRMEITHWKKPKTNKILSNILAHNTVAYYQPPLTQQEIEEGCIQPDNIAGSYAFYHATKGGMVTPTEVARGITTGKFGHKPRPRIIDDNGDWVWGELFIDLAQGLQIITIPLEFWEYAKYPIRHDAGADTFGYTTKGSGSEQYKDYIIGTAYSCSESGTATSMSAYVGIGAGQSGNLKFGLYLESDDSRTGYTDEWNFSAEYLNWKALNIISGGSLSAADYYLGWWTDNSYVSFYYDTGVAGFYDPETYDGFPDPLNPTSWADHKFSIYCTYTPSVAGQPTMKRWGGVPFMEPKGKGVW